MEEQRHGQHIEHTTIMLNFQNEDVLKVPVYFKLPRFLPQHRLLWANPIDFGLV